MDYSVIKPGDSGPFSKDDIADFLFEHLEQYGDKREHIAKCLDYALSNKEGQGGFIAVASEKGRILGVVVINETGMGGYIPENILVYIAVHADTRGKGVGRSLMVHAIEHTTGDIALHVEPDNPAARLYRKIGFTSKYLEMRYHK
ncbi:MAG: GNAT family N-acetyltransferase [Cyclonatronaceae bacterium]